uniref:Advillin n=1 Tax=Myripristis murdjan TaxID=586833 RepID=A0A668A4T9_9TELE
MDLVQIPEKSYGNFYEGDCYVLLFTQKVGSFLGYDIHYWIGSQSSQDEQGAAAVYTIQLDEFLGLSPVQHREVQGHESDAFRGYFKQGIIYKKGGVASGMRHTETNSYNIERLLHVKGKKRVTAMEVEMSWQSFNLGDVFLVDIGKTIIQWNGPSSNKQERLKGMLLAKDIRDRERGGRAEIRVIEGDAEDDCSQHMALLTSVLGERTITLTTAAVSQWVKLFVWKGKRANKAERQAAMSRALEFIKAKNYPITTNVETVNDGAESALFKQLFQSWTVKDQTQGLGRVHTRGKVADVTQEKFDAALMHVMPQVAAHERMVDNGTGQVEVWRIEDLELVPVEPQWYGYFYGGDCYLVLYSYQAHNKNSYLLYIWQGRHASQDELAASAFQAVNLDQKYGGQPVQVRITMGKEPRHFMAIFKGKMVIFEGGTSRKGTSDPEPPIRLFQVHGTDPSNTKAIEVPALASSLNSNDVFLLKSQSEQYLWCGKGSSGDERAMAKEISFVIGQKSGADETVAEGQEPIEFWELLGGKAPYANSKRLQQTVLDHQPRLFVCSNKTGRFIVTEVTQFTQDDLSEDDVMLLDTWDQVFLWVGKEANEVERKEAVVISQEYLRTHPGARDPDTPVILIKQEYEPPTFTGWFTAWDPSKWNGGKSYEELKKELGDLTNPVLIAKVSTTSFNSERSFQVYPPEALVNKHVSELPEDVDPTQKEVLYLQDFCNVFGITKDQFASLPQWKQLKIKKDKGMF